MTTEEMARDFVALCAKGDFAGAGEAYWAEDVVSAEPMGDNAVVHGKAAARGKGEWWEGAHTIHAAEAHGPYVNGDQFAVRFVMDMEVKQTGERRHMDEVALYTVKNGKIAEERFFYGG